MSIRGRRAARTLVTCVAVMLGVALILRPASSASSSVAAVAAGDLHSLARQTDGTVWTWGDNDAGQLGDGTTLDRNTPARVDGLNGVAAVAAGSYHNLALKEDGTIWAWGRNNLGQLGDGTTTTTRPTPVQVSGLTGVVDVAAGWDHSLALRSDGTVWAWGYNAFGQVGIGSTTEQHTPVQISGLTGIVAVAGGGYHSLALKSDGTVWAWGYNSTGQLGDGTTTDRYTPVRVAFPANSPPRGRRWCRPHGARGHPGHPGRLRLLRPRCRPAHLRLVLRLPPGGQQSRPGGRRHGDTILHSRRGGLVRGPARGERRHG
ncbi:hypothetical protein LIP_0843 [Limnochorda pilosa]|uniref:RCC1-like domain-containing protein n=1 Tax=Limnochorda pilosa TaxID=1555112 RepID=A0A0K2SHZ4_LIMPI|nr:hypothetical protein [Limnochorda pilosa]BAS26700.1 hypothetical protein LIP_0843 [Limnochorda pilosa]